MGRSLNTFQAEDLFYFAADPDPECIKPYSKHVEARYTLPQHCRAVLRSLQAAPVPDIIKFSKKYRKYCLTKLVCSGGLRDADYFVLFLFMPLIFKKSGISGWEIIK